MKARKSSLINFNPLQILTAICSDSFLHRTFLGGPSMLPADHKEGKEWTNPTLETIFGHFSTINAALVTAIWHYQICHHISSRWKTKSHKQDDSSLHSSQPSGPPLLLGQRCQVPFTCTRMHEPTSHEASAFMAPVLYIHGLYTPTFLTCREGRLVAAEKWGIFGFYSTGWDSYTAHSPSSLA